MVFYRPRTQGQHSRARHKNHQDENLPLPLEKKGQKLGRRAAAADRQLQLYFSPHHRSYAKGGEKMSDSDLWKKMYSPEGIPPKVKQRKKKSGFEKTHWKLDVGDWVKVSHLKKAFTREYSQQFSIEVFKVVDRYKKQNVQLYSLVDYDGDPIEGKFYAWELQKVIVDENSEFRIDKIVKRKGDKVFVSWLGFPKKFSSWISKASLVDYDQ